MQQVKDFAEYMYLLLPSALRQIGKKLNQWWALCKVLGRRFDRLKSVILDLREQAMLLSCAPELLPVYGQDRDMPRLKGEDIELYRRRLTMKREIAEQAGTNTGVWTLMRSFGYENISIEPACLTASAKWAEATVWISGGALVIDDRDIIIQELRKIKQASALLHLAQEQVYDGVLYTGACVDIAKIIDIGQV